MTLNAIDNPMGFIFLFIVWNHLQISDIDIQLFDIHLDVY